MKTLGGLSSSLASARVDSDFELLAMPAFYNLENKEVGLDI